MKTRYVYTVIREISREISNKDIESELDFFRGVTDEPEEYLYGSSALKEKVTVDLQFNVVGDKWISSKYIGDIKMLDEIYRMLSAKDIPDPEVLGKFSPK